MIRFIKLILVIIGLAVVGFIGYKAVTYKLERHEQTQSQTEPSKVTAAVRNAQLECLARNIYYEAGNQPFEGKVAVAQVTMNRVESGVFPNDVCKVIYQKNVVYEKVLCQFSWYCTNPSGKPPKHTEMYRESELVARQVLLEGFRLPGLKDAMYFHGDYINPGWKRERVAKIGNHIFYK
jgi:spore germination cell wall hydrolase CwlJ-like protein